MQVLARSVRGVVAEMRQIHTDYRVLWRKRDGRATLSRGECPDPCFAGLLLGLICIRIQVIYVKLISHCQAEMIK